jgi:hypothetical protein
MSVESLYRSAYLRDNNVLSYVAINNGLIEGCSTRGIIGYNTDVDVGTELVWEGPTTTYTYPSNSGETMTLSSTNAGDNGKPVYIEGLSANLETAQTDVVLVGQNTNLAFSRINFMLNVSPTGGDFLGVVSLKNLALTTTYSLIPVGRGRSQQLVFSIARDSTGYFISAIASINKNASAEATLYVQVRRYQSVFSTAGRWGLSGAGSSFAPFRIEDDPLLPGGTDVEVRAEATANNIDISGRVAFLLVKN